MTQSRSPPPFDLTGKVALVTGGSRGLGREMVAGFAQAGADVVIASRDGASCAAYAARDHRRHRARAALGVAAHVGHWARARRRWSRRPTSEFGRVDVLVNNAGMSPLYDGVDRLTEDLFDKVLAVNLKGPFRLAALVGTRMAAGPAGRSSTSAAPPAARPRPTCCPTPRPRRA